MNHNNYTTKWPLISVVLACYNGERFLKEQIESILEQDYTNLELIIVDDASTDSSTDIIHFFAEKDSRLKLFHNEKTIGYVKNFEKGMRLAIGNFIALSDQDDIWLPTKLSTLYSSAENHILVYSDSLLIDQNGKILNRKLSDIKRLIEFDSCLSYAVGGSIPGHAMLIKRSLISKCIPFPDIFPHDYWIGFMATCYGSIKYVNIPLVAYRQHDKNIFGANLKNKKSTRVINEIKKNRMSLLAEHCPDYKVEKRILLQLSKYYNNPGLINNLKRGLLFYQFKNAILAYKHRSDFRKFLFCLKTIFVKP